MEIVVGLPRSLSGDGGGFRSRGARVRCGHCPPGVPGTGPARRREAQYRVRPPTSASSGCEGAPAAAGRRPGGGGGDPSERARRRARLGAAAGIPRGPGGRAGPGPRAGRPAGGTSVMSEMSLSDVVLKSRRAGAAGRSARRRQERRQQRRRRRTLLAVVSSRSCIVGGAVGIAWVGPVAADRPPDRARRLHRHRQRRRAGRDRARLERRRHRAACSRTRTS